MEREREEVAKRQKQKKAFLKEAQKWEKEERDTDRMRKENITCIVDDPQIRTGS